jgi:hypothetical protein
MEFRVKTLAAAPSVSWPRALTLCQVQLGELAQQFLLLGSILFKEPFRLAER